jgi:hypothetical protein
VVIEAAEQFIDLAGNLAQFSADGPRGEQQFVTAAEEFCQLVPINGRHLPKSFGMPDRVYGANLAPIGGWGGGEMFVFIAQ